MARCKIIKYNKETVDTIRNFTTESRFLELKEILDNIFEKDVFNSHCDSRWSDEEIAKLDYILCELQMTIDKNKNIKVVIEE